MLFGLTYWTHNVWQWWRKGRHVQIKTNNLSNILKLPSFWRLLSKFSDSVENFIVIDCVCVCVCVFVASSDPEKVPVHQVSLLWRYQNPPTMGQQYSHRQGSVLSCADSQTLAIMLLLMFIINFLCLQLWLPMWPSLTCSKTHHIFHKRQHS